jgi:pimeloyl-ACP methyl ester carboxylesterase
VQMDDVAAVLDSVGIERAFVWGTHDATPLTILFAASFPERVQGLVLWGPNPPSRASRTCRGSRALPSTSSTSRRR